MATVIGVGMQMTANASGMTKGLSDADKALQLLQKIVEQNQKSLQRFTGEADKTSQSLDKLTRGVGTLSTIEVGRVLVSGFQALSSAFTSAAQNVLTLAGNVSQSLDSLNDLSARTGIGVESLQAYSLAAKLAGVDAAQFGTAIQKLSVNIGKANAGDAFDKSLRGIGLTVAELKALAPERQFSEIGEAISRLPTVADRAAAAVEIFGKQGAALAPLFREGAASIEELQARAERLGIIVSETQINNVADMNDAFDLVRATVEGIIGQVVGNLAPAVTEVTNQFLKFVEEWSGTAGEGGTGIANAITDVLLQGAEVFAGVFDRFVGTFGSFTETLSGVSAAFGLAANIFATVSESLRAAFNVFELAGNAISMALGKLLEGIGGYLSSDLEAYGKELQRQAQAATDRNSRELEAAATNAANAVVNAFTGGQGSAESAGAGAAVQYVQGFADEVQRARIPEVKVAADLADATAELDQFLTTAEDGASAFLQESQATLATFSRMAAEGELTASQIQIMNGFMKNLNAELEKEKQLRLEATEAAEKQAAADGKRVEGLLKTSDAASKVEEDLAAVQRQRAAIEQQTGEEAQARLEQLDALRLKLEDQQQAIDQGFGDGFEATFQKINAGISSTVEKAQEFGQAGFDAAVRLQEGIAAAQQQARDGILNREAFENQVAQQQAIFDQEIKNLEEADRKKQELENAGERRIEEQRKAAQKELEDAAKAQADAERNAQEQANAAQQQIAQAQQRQYEEAQKAQQAFLEEQAKAQQAEFERQQNRLRELNTLGARSVQTADVRTQEGAALVIGLAAEAQDPNLIEARQQSKLLRQINQSILNTVSGAIGRPVTIGVLGARA
jgi:hypothetical protein